MVTLMRGSSSMAASRCARNSAQLAGPGGGVVGGRLVTSGEAAGSFVVVAAVDPVGLERADLPEGAAPPPFREMPGEVLSSDEPNQDGEDVRCETAPASAPVYG